MFDCFKEIITMDFEYYGSDGDRPTPICYVAHELRSGRKHRLWRDQFGPAPPHPIGPDVLVVAYFASADLNCYRVLGWPLPARVLDHYTEFRKLTCGLKPPASGHSLLGALSYFGLGGIDAGEKTYWRDLVLTGGPYDADQRTSIQGYCETDVDALDRLLPRMAPHIDLHRAVGVRGRYMRAVSAMEHNGVPIDVAGWRLLQEHWTDIQDALIETIDRDFGCFEGRTFKQKLFEQCLLRLGIPFWPRTLKGGLDLEDDTFRQMAKLYPVISPLRELRSSLSDLRLRDLRIGSDGRNRTMLSPFASISGRNQPSNSKFIFGPSVWLRGYIKPLVGFAVAYLDWKQQEFGIAAALSGDKAMMAAYRTGDPYLAFAKQAGAVPADATKESHGDIREQYKALALGVQYGMGFESLALRIDQPRIMGRLLLRVHHETYPRFWEWSDAMVDFAMLNNFITTVFGWPVYLDEDPNPRSLRNFSMQGNASEAMRIACILGTEAGIEICAPVHDAVLICAPVGQIEADVKAMQAYMAEASRLVLGGFELCTDATIVRYPNRYQDKRGVVMWNRVNELIARAARDDGGALTA